jgi:hypothetical protein
MPMAVGGLAALVALAAGILGSVDPTTCVLRAGIALLLGLFGTQVWYVMIAGENRSALQERQASLKPKDEPPAG